jgi:hypothetical protein
LRKEAKSTSFVAVENAARVLEGAGEQPILAGCGPANPVLAGCGSPNPVLAGCGSPNPVLAGCTAPSSPVLAGCTAPARQALLAGCIIDSVPSRLTKKR